MRKVLITILIIIYFLVMFAVAASAAAANNQEEPRFSVSDQGAQLPSFIRSMALSAGYDCVIDKELKGVTLVSFTEVTLPEAMDLLAKAHNFNWSIEGNKLVVARTDTTSQLKVFSLRYADPDLARKDLLAFIPEKQVVVNPEASSITVEGTYNQIAKATKRLKNLDIPTKRIHIQATFVEIRQSNSQKLGLSYTWGSFDNTMTTRKDIPYAITMDAEKIISNGRILASPSIMTLNGRTAEIIAGEKVPVPIQNESSGNKTITYDYKDVGYKIKTTPRVNVDESGKEYITLAIEPEASAITGYVTNEGSKAPQISTRTAKTNVRVESGGAVIIGGLVRDEDLKSMTGIPGISKIPILGELFKTRNNSSEKNEIFILVKPIVVEEPVTIIKEQASPVTEPAPQDSKEPVVAAPADKAAEAAVKEAG